MMPGLHSAPAPVGVPFFGNSAQGQFVQALRQIDSGDSFSTVAAHLGLSWSGGSGLRVNGYVDLSKMCLEPIRFEPQDVGVLRGC